MRPHFNKPLHLENDMVKDFNLYVVQYYIHILYFYTYIQSAYI